MRSLPYYLFLIVLLSCHQKAVEEEDGCNYNRCTRADMGFGWQIFNI